MLLFACCLFRQLTPLFFSSTKNGFVDAPTISFGSQDGDATEADANQILDDGNCLPAVANYSVIQNSADGTEAEVIAATSS